MPMQKTVYTLLNFVLPNRCIICTEYLDIESELTHVSVSLCYECWNKIEFISHTSCEKCGGNIDFDGAECRHCYSYPFAFGQAKACIVYNKNSQKLFFQLKHHANDSIVSMMGKWMISRLKSFEHNHDIIIAMPLSRWRLFSRGFNQSSLLLYEIQKQKSYSFIDLSHKILRIKNTPSQGHKCAKDRQTNVKGAFQACEHSFKGKSVLLIDDVLTSGASLNECANELLCKGASRVDVLVVGRA
ncbi:MAG: hypothetical protein C0432_04315 [Candidatus Puniceispirillum sp.]|nr:hypothetical protein [Candidatus Pelagibacter sp.]MBA4283500.1 hypothetical protein [Candidatus Puniceispirillum sp.]